MMTRRLMAIAVLSGVLGCGSVVPLDAAPKAAFAWVDGTCLALAEGALGAGDTVTLVDLGEARTVTAARIVGPAAAEDCPALAEERGAVNRAAHAAFLRLDAGSASGAAIAVIGTEGGDGAADVAEIDTDANGVPDGFSLCLTQEGARYQVWPGPAGEGSPLWEGYAYLGYDNAPTCPQE